MLFWGEVMQPVSASAWKLALAAEGIRDADDEFCRLTDHPSCRMSRHIREFRVSQENRDGEAAAVSVAIIHGLLWFCWSYAHSLHTFRAMGNLVEAQPRRMPSQQYSGQNHETGKSAVRR
jgi:hypothetical protein